MDASAYLQPRWWGPRLLERMQRLQLRRVQAPVLVWVIACWIMALAVIVALLWPGAMGAVSVGPVEAAAGLTGFVAPLWFRVLVVVSAAALAGAAVVIAETLRFFNGARRIVAEVAIAAALIQPVLVLLADGAWPYVIPAALLAAGAEGTMRIAPVPRAIPAAFTAAVWLVLLVYQFTPAGADPTSWVWIALPGLATAFAAFGTYYGVARAAESRSGALRFLVRERWHPIAVFGAVLTAAAIVMLRLTVLRELFPEPDPQLWAPLQKPPVSWLLATVVACTLAGVAIASTRRPLLRVGQRRVTAGLAVLGNLHLVVMALLVLVGLVLAVFGVVGVPLHWLEAVPVLKVIGVALLVILVLFPAFRGTAARWLVIVAALFLLPVTLAGAVGDQALPGFAPTPVQVTIVLVGVALVLAISNLFGARFRPSLVARLAVVPVVAVHAGWLLPAAWSQWGLVVAVLGVLAGFVLFQPAPVNDESTHSARVLTAAGMLLLTVATALVAAPSLLDDSSLIVLGLVWLSVLVVAALCFETIEPEVRAKRPVAPTRPA